MVRFAVIFFSLILIHTNAFSEEISGGGSEQFTGGQERGLDFSNVEPRDDVNLCSEQDLQERQERQDQCVQNFSEWGITQTIRPHEVVEAQSCDRIESFSEYLAGCAQFFLDLPGDTIGGIAPLFGAGRHDQAIEQACGERPTISIGASRRSARGGGITPAQEAEARSYNSARERRNACAEGVVAAAEQADAAVEAQIAGYRTQCRASFAAGGIGNQRRLARHGDRHTKGCMLEKAGRDGCDACIAQLTEVPIGPRIINSVLDEFRKHRGFFCYNKETQGRMVCAAIATAAGIPLGGAAASLAAKLPVAFRGARAAAGPSVSRMRAAADAAADAAEETGDAASNIAAVRAGRVTEEALEANGSLDDVDRVVAAQRLLDDRALTPEQSRAIVQAHEVGADRPGSGYGNYTQAELREKNRILTEAGFSADDRRLLMDQGIVGRMAADGGGRSLYEQVMDLPPPSSPQEALANARLRRQFMDSPEFQNYSNPEEFTRRTQNTLEQAWRSMRRNGDYEGSLSALQELRDISPAQQAKINQHITRTREIAAENGVAVSASPASTAPASTTAASSSPAVRATPSPSAAGRYSPPNTRGALDEMSDLRTSYNPATRDQTLTSMTEQVELLEQEYRRNRPQTFYGEMARDYEDLRTTRARYERGTPEYDAIDLQMQAFENHGASRYDYFARQRGTRTFVANRQQATERITALNSNQPRFRNSYSPQQRRTRRAEEDQIISLLRPPPQQRQTVQAIRDARDQIRSLRTQPYNNGARNRSIQEREREIQRYLRTLPTDLQRLMR